MISKEIDKIKMVSNKQLFTHVTKKWKFVVMGAVIGGGLGALFWGASERKYQATMIVKVAQVMKLAQDGQSQIVNIESPEALIEKLRMPGFYSEQTILNCGLQVEDKPKVELARMVRGSLVKGAPSELILAVDHISANASAACANGIFERVKSSESDSANKVTEAALVKRSRIEKKMSEILKLVTKVDEQNGPVSGVYLVSRDQLLNYNNEVQRLGDIIEFNEKNRTEVVQPLTTSISNRYLSSYLAVLFGTLLGAVISVLIAMLSHIKHIERS